MTTAAPPRKATRFPISVRDIERHEFMIEHTKTGMLLVLVPGGKFLAGGSGSDEGRGKFEVELPAFYMGLHPVTNRQYGKFVGETKHGAPNNNVWQEAGKAEHPVEGVTWKDAQAYCGWAGLRLPRELEWEKAARGVDGRKYPWGEEWDKKKCRNFKNDGSDTTAGVWSYGVGASPWGAMQMSGNVWEWCEDWYEEEAYDRYKRGDMKPPESGEYRVVRGGSWSNDNPGNLTASLRHLRYTPSNRDYFSHRGFRCVLGVSP